MPAPTARGAVASVAGFLAAPDTATVVVEPEHDGPGSWAGAPSAVLADGSIHQAYRLRRPVGQGRGFADVVARSTDGVRFEPVATVRREDFGGRSLERPCLVRTPDGRWRVNVSGATTVSKHWRVDLLEVERLEDLDAADRRTVMPGDEQLAVKDPVVRLVEGTWHACASRHPLDDPDATDRMTTDHGRESRRHHLGVARHRPSGPAGGWDARRPGRGRPGGPRAGLLRRPRDRRAELGGADRPRHHRQPGPVVRRRRPTGRRLPARSRRAALRDGSAAAGRDRPPQRRGDPRRRGP